MLVSITRSFPKPFLAFVLGSVSAAAAAQGTAPVVVPYTVTTVAGDTQSPVASLYAGNGSGAAGLPVNLPVGVAIDASHNLYIADGGNNLIWQVTAAGVSNILAGKAPSIGCVGTTCGVNRGDTGNAGPAGSAEIDLPLENDNPGQVAVDSNGNVYFVESSQRVRVLYNGGTTMAAFLKSIYPTSTIAAGNVYTIAGNGNYGWLDGPALSAQFHQPAGLAVDASGNVYIGSNRDNAVRVLNTQNSAITVFGTTIQPGYIGTVIGTGCVANGNAGTCEYAALTNNLAAASTVINWAEGIWLDSYGNLFVASFANTSTTTYKGIAVAYNGGTGNPMTALLATLNGSAPTVGHVYLLAGKGSKNINTIANYASLGSSLYVNGVRGVASDPSGNVYYSDTNYNAVYRIDAVTGLVSLIAGGGTYKGTTSAASPAYCSGTGGLQTTTPDGDGCAQNAVNLNQPSGIASDTSGNLYIVDSGNNSIRRISSGLSFPTVNVGQSAAQNLLIHFYANNLPATGSPFAIGSGPFALSGTPACTSNADSSKDCVVTIVFTPTATGTAAGTLQATGTGGATTSFQLAGTGSATASTTTLSVSAYQTAPGNSITYTATVTGGATTPAGTVNFYQNGAPLGAGSLNGSGVATFTANGLAAGVYQVYAAYSPSGTYSASNSNTQVIAVAAASGADFTMTVPTYNWSQVAQGGASSTVLATLTNSTGATVGPMTITGSNAALAFSNSTCGVGMLPGAVCTFDVELEPSLTYATGSYTGTITAASGSYTSNPGLTMTGTVLPAGFVFAPASISSGSQLLNMTGSATTVSLTNNTGTAFSSSNPIAIQAPAGFTVSANTCSGTVASNGGSCTFNVTFTPSSATAYSGNLSATGGSYANAMPLSGTGVTPSIVTSPASYSWPLPTAQGGQSTVQTMTITNNTGSTLAVPSITPGTGLAIGSNTCSASLAWNSSCSFTVQLAPSLTYSVGPYSGTVTVSSGSYHSSISFSGNVIVAGFVFSPASIAFGSQFLTASGGSATVTVANNTGTTFGSGTSLAIAAPPGYTVNANGCSGMVAANGGTCSFNLSFSPAAGGTYNGNLTASGSTYTNTMALTGTSLNSPELIPYTVSTVAGDPQAPIASLYGGTGTGAVGLPLNLPVGVGVDTSFNLYIADAGNDLLREVNAAGISNLLAGTAPSVGCTGVSCPLNQGDTGNAGPAASAEINLPLVKSNPGQLAVDPNGNVYFVEINHRVRMLYRGGAAAAAFLQNIYPAATIAAGNIYTIAGDGSYGWLDGPALSAQFHQPAGLAIDASGNVYIGDNLDNAVRVLNTQSAAITVFGTTIAPGYTGTVVGTNCVANGTAGTCQNGVLTNNLAASSTVINWAQGLSLDSYGDLLIAADANTSTTTYKGIAMAYNGGAGNPMTALLTTLNGVAPTVGNVYLLAGTGSQNSNTITNYSSLGSALHVNGVHGVAADPAGNVYYTDSNYNAVYRIDGVTGLVSLVAGGGTYNPGASSAAPAYCSGTSGPQTSTPDGDGCVQAAVNLNSPYGIASDANGNLYVVDAGNNAIRKIAGGSAFPTVDVGLTVTQNLLVHFYANALPAASSIFTIANGPFTVSGMPACASNADGSEDCVVAVAFTPATAGPASGSLIAATAGGNAPAIALTGAGSGTATTTALSVSPSYQSVPGTSIAYTATVTDGGSAVSSGSVTFYQNGISVGSVPLSSGAATYAAGALAVGTYQVAATYNPGGTYAASVSGTQIVTIAPNNSGFTLLSPSSLSWTTPVAQGGQSSVLTATVANDTNTTVAAPSITPSAGVVVGSNTCTVGMLPGDSCTFTVELEPSASYTVGTFSGTVTVAAGSFSTGIAVTGTVIAAGFAFSPASLAFTQAQLADTSSSAATVTLINNTGTTFSSSNPIVVAAPSGYAMSANNCAGTVAANGGTCTFGIVFWPTAAGAATGNVNASGASYSNNLSVTGTAAPQPVPVPYIVSTVAGDAQAPVAALYGGTGVAAVGLPLDQPVGVAVDASLNLYIADGDSNLLRTVNAASGVSTILAGTAPAIGCVGTSCLAASGENGNEGPAASAQIELPQIGNNPGQVAVDSYGNVYFVESDHRVRMIYNGGSAVKAFLQSIYPSATIAAGDLYTIAGDGSYGWKDGSALSAQFHQPAGLAVDASGNVYVGDNDDDAVRVLNTQNAAITLFGTTIQPSYVGTIVGASCVSGSSCQNGTLTNGLAASSTVVNQPQAIWVDAFGNVFIASWANTSNTTHKGVSVAYSGGAGNPMAALLTTLNGAAPTAGNVYLLLGTGSTSLSAVMGTVANYADLGAAFDVSGPRAVATDANGNLYYADSSFNGVYRIDAVNGKVSLIAGTRAYKSSNSASSPAYCNGNSGPQTTTPDYDGCVQSAVNLNTPSGLTVDKYGNLYILDSSNNAIRKAGIGSAFPTVDVGQSVTQQMLLHFYANALPQSASSFSIGFGPYALSGTPACANNPDSTQDCVVSITFTPTAAGSAPGALSVATSANGNASIALNGTGSGTATATVLSVSPSPQVVPGTSITYNATVTGDTTTPAGTVTFYQNGVSLGAVALSGGSASYSAGSLAPGIYQVAATYNPSGTYAASNSNAQMVTVASNTGYLTLAAANTNWSQPVAQGGKSTALPVTVTNNTGAAIGALTITGSTPLVFATNTCGVGLLPGGTCTFNVQLEPGSSYATGAYSGTVTATSGTSTSNAALTFTGTVIAPQFDFSASTIAFGAEVVSVTSAATAVTLTNNTGTAFSSSSPIAIAPPSGYTVTSNTCATGNTAANGGTCTFNVAFAPATTGADNANLTASAGSVSGTLPLTGTGVAQALLFNPTTLAFGNQALGTSSVVQVTITNQTASTLNLNNAGTITNPIGLSIGNANFLTDMGSGISGCTHPLIPFATCTVNVYFQPTGTAGTQLSTTLTAAAAGISGSLPVTGTIQSASSNTAGTIGLSSGTASVNENAGTVSFTVSRTGGSTGAITATYGTADGTALGIYDYVPTSGTLSWASGDTTTRTITVPINDDHITGGGTKTFDLELTGNTGGASLGSPSLATVTIADNDATVPSFFVVAGSAQNVWSVNPTATFTGSSYGNSGTPTYQWFLNAGPSGGTIAFGSPTSATTTATPSITGFYDIGFTVTDSTGSKTDYTTLSYFPESVEIGTPAETFNNFNYTPTQLQNWFEWAPTFTYNFTGISNSNLKPPPAPGVHPRILLNPEDLPSLRTRLTSTMTGQTAMGTIRSTITANLTGSSSQFYSTYQNLIAGSVSSFEANSNQHGIVTMIMYEAFRATIDQDQVGGQNAATALATIAPYIVSTIRSANSLDWRNVNSLDLYLDSYAFAYDFAYSFMTPAQQAAARQPLTLGTTNQWSIGMDALDAYHANSSNWISNNLDYMFMNALAVEGEAGSDPFIIPRARAAMDRETYFSFGPEGAYFEGMGKGQLGAEMWIAMAKRNHMNIATTNIRNHISEFYLHTMMPWGNGWTWDELLGGDNEASKLADVPGVKWAFPNDPNIDFVYRNDYACNTGTGCYSGTTLTSIDVIYPYNEVALLARAIYAQDWNTSQTWAQAASALNGVEPDYYFDNMRGLAIFRDQWGANATRIIFQPRSEPGGHSEPDRNHIAFYALGRPWIPFIVNDGSHAPQSGYVSGTTNAEAASTMHIDGYSVSALPAHVDDLNTSNAIYSYATGDATLPMNWQPQTSGGSIVQTWTYAQTQYTPGTYPFYNIPTWETPDWEFSEQDINGYQAINDTNYQMANFPGSAVQYAFRTAGIVRGSDPFAIVTDDVKIDGNSHNYLFRLMTMPDLTISYPSSTQALLTDPATGNKTLIAVINASSTVSFTPNSFPNGITDGAYGAFTWSSVPSLDLAYTSTANPASIRVIIMAIPSGGSLPSIVYSNNVLTVQTSDGVTSTVTFSTATDGHETFSATNVH